MTQSYVQLAPGIVRIPTMALDFLNSYAFLEDDGSVTLVDTGVKNSPPRIHAALAELGKRPEDVRRVLLTHAHGDHVGGAKQLWDHGGKVSIHEDDTAILESGEPIQGTSTTLPARLWWRLPRPTWDPPEVSATFADGEVLDVAGGLQVIHTPGHTPGHVSFLHQRSGVLITGDALFNFLHRVTFSPRLFCWDVPQSRETAARLGELDYEVAAFIHGPEIRHDARERIRKFLRRKRVA